MGEVVVLEEEAVPATVQQTPMEMIALAVEGGADPAVIDQIIANRLDKACVWLWVLVRRGRFRQLAGLIVNIVVTLRRPINAVSPM